MFWPMIPSLGPAWADVSRVGRSRCLGTNYVMALEDFFFVYPTKLREYQQRYRNSFLHGGISPEEMIVPVARLTPRPR